MPVTLVPCSRCSRQVNVYHDPADDLTRVVCVACVRRELRSRPRAKALKLGTLSRMGGAGDVPSVEVGYQGSD